MLPPTLAPRLLLALMRLPDPLAGALALREQEVDGQALSLRMRLFLRLIRLDRRGRHLRPVAAQRAVIDHVSQHGPGPPRPAAVQPLTLPGPAGPLGARLYRPLHAQGPLAGLLYLHGGGFVVGNLDSHDRVCRRIADEAGCAVLALDYRRAPEARFPAAVEDCAAGLRHLITQAAALGLDPTRLAVGGDSAGGNLAAVAARLCTPTGAAPLRAQLLLYPATDFRCDSASMSQFAEGFYLTAAQVRWFRDTYLGPGEHDLDDWRLSPLRLPTLEGLPPAIVVTAGLDPLRDEGRAFAARLQAGGVPVRHVELPGLVHGFLNLGGVLPEADAGLSQICALLREALGGA